MLIDAVGEAATSQVSAQVHQVDGRDVARVHAIPSAFPVTQQGKGDDGPTLWVRLGNGTRGVTDPGEIERYVSTRWPGGAGSGI